MVFRTEQQFENALINILEKQRGWKDGILKNPTEEDLIKNWADILFAINNETDRLNGVPLNRDEMMQVLHKVNEQRTPLKKNEFINGQSVSIRRDNPLDKQNNGHLISLKLFDRREVAGGISRYQIAQQPIFIGKDNIKGDNRGDIMLLINGMPLIHVELKRSETPVSNAVNQIQRYIHNSVFSTGIYSLVQVFMAMTPTEMRYFANPGNDPSSQINENYVFEWANVVNEPVSDWKEVASLFMSIPMAHQMIAYYTIADSADDTLKVLRSYQVYAVRRIVDRVRKYGWYDNKQHGGYIWHTTGSGKTLTSFKAADVIASYGLADKVIFLMDRIELGTQTLNEFKSFASFEKDVQGTDNTNELYNKLRSEKYSERLIVTSIQKMSKVTNETYGDITLDDIRNKRIVIIIDEAHRSTFGEMIMTIKQTFPNALFFGFTGTPLHEENALKGATTATIFGDELHRYSLADGIRDENVLGFDVTQVSTLDYKALREEVALKEANADTLEEVFRDPEKQAIYNYYKDHSKIKMLTYTDNTSGELHPGIESTYILNGHFKTEGHQKKVVQDIYDNWMSLSQGSAYSAILTTSSRKEAIQYYRLLKDNPLGITVTALFDSNLNESDDTIFIEDGLRDIIEGYNGTFDKSYRIATHDLFKEDLSARLARKGAYRNLKENDIIHLVIVVNQLLTGYDSKWINTLYVDRVMEYANIIQAFSRTNRLNGETKPFGSIRYYRRIYLMEENIKKAVASYSGGREVGLFVNKLGGNLREMNRITEDIMSVYAVDNIKHFEELPKDQEAKKKFAQLFNSFDGLLEAATIQGFMWEQDEYFVEVTANKGKENVKVLFTEEFYQVWLQRYSELPTTSGESSPNSALFDINYTLVEKGAGRIDYDYLNNNFQRFVRNHREEGSKDERMRIKDDLHRSFAKLPVETQGYAGMVINDLESGELVVDNGMEFTDYINEYKDRSESRHVKELVLAIGVNESMLRELMNLNIKKDTLNEFGRFDKLKSTIDRNVAKAYLEQKLEEKLSPIKVNMQIDNLLTKFILSGGFDIEEYIYEY